jgi:hypothetical protein
MAHAIISAPLGPGTANSKAKQVPVAIAWVGVVILAALFVLKYVVFYFRHYGPVSFDPYWPRRGWLFLHINAGHSGAPDGAIAVLDWPRQRNLTISGWGGSI